MNLVGYTLSVSLILFTISKSIELYEKNKRIDQNRESAFKYITIFLNKPRVVSIRNGNSSIKSIKINEDTYNIHIKNKNENYQFDLYTGHQNPQKSNWIDLFDW